MLAKNRLAATVAVALGASIGGISTANAAAAFWPYLALGTQVTTVISVMNTSDLNYNQFGLPVAPGAQGNMHYRLYYKPVSVFDGPIDNPTPCNEVNTYLPTSQNDLQSIDMTGHFTASPDTKGVLFNDPSVNNNWAASGKNFALGQTLVPPGARAYLIVNNNDSAARSVTGEAFLFDFGAGAVWGYQASTSTDTNAPGYNFFGAVGVAMPNPTTITVMPPDETTTALFVTPLGNAVGLSAVETAGQIPPINTYTSTIAFVTDSSYAMFDRDENIVSGTAPQNVTCVGRVDAKSLLSSGAWPLLQDGGFGQLVTQRVDAAHPFGFVPPVATGESAVEKLEYNLSSSFNGVPVVGSFNNGFRLLAGAGAGG